MRNEFLSIEIEVMSASKQIFGAIENHVTLPTCYLVTRPEWKPCFRSLRMAVYPFCNIMENQIIVPWCSQRETRCQLDQLATTQLSWETTFS